MSQTLEILDELHAWDPPPEAGTHRRDMSRDGYFALCGAEMLGIRLPAPYSSCEECERLSGNRFWGLFA